MNDFLKVLLGLVLLSAIPLGWPDFDWDDIEIEKEI